MRVICIQSRQVADDVYDEGVEYEVDEARAAKYAEYFRPLPPLPTPEPEPEKRQPFGGLFHKKEKEVTVTVEDEPEEAIEEEGSEDEEQA